MPTGYTYRVKDGKITEFKDFAMECVRGMGVCIMMRDAPSDAPIPERWEPDVDHHLERIGSAVQRKAKLEAMSKDEVEQECLKAYEASLAQHVVRVAGNDNEKKRYEAMLAKVEAWVPPTKDHVDFKDFMISQLKESIRFDCGYTPDAPVLRSAEEWLVSNLSLAQSDIYYHTKARQEEIDRTESRNKWMADFRKSLP